MWYHEKEASTVGVLLDYGTKHDEELLTFTYGTDESYICKFMTAYESDNTAEVEDQGAAYKEFFVIAYAVLKVIFPGPHYGSDDGGIEVTYFDMPEQVQDSQGNVIYQAR